MDIEKIRADLLSKYDTFARINDTLFGVVKNRKWGIYSVESGTLVVPVEYDNISHFTYPSLLLMKKDGRFGFFSIMQNALVVPVEYDTVERLKETLYFVKVEGRCGLFSTETGKVTWEE